MLASIQIFAQAPEKINYQVVIRGNYGNPIINEQVNVSFIITDFNGGIYNQPSVIYNTNDFGMLNIEIGPIAGINWSANPVNLATNISTTTINV